MSGTDYTGRAILCSEAAKRVRLNIIRLAYNAGKKGAHLAPSLSIADILAVLYKDVIQHKDHFVLSKGHGALCWYAAMYEVGLLTKEQLDSFENNGGFLPGQPSRNLELGIEFSSGSLGLGMSFAAGLAWDAKHRCSEEKIYVLLGDGELNEGSVWESIMFAKQHNLNNLIAIVDKNGMQSDGLTSDILEMDLVTMWRSFGWTVIACNGHDTSALIKAFHENSTSKPIVIIAETTKGKGVSFMENSSEWHHNHLSQEQYQNALLDLGGDLLGV